MVMERGRAWALGLLGSSLQRRRLRSQVAALGRRDVASDVTPGRGAGWRAVRACDGFVCLSGVRERVRARPVHL